MSKAFLILNPTTRIRSKARVLPRRRYKSRIVTEYSRKAWLSAAHGPPTAGGDSGRGGPPGSLKKTQMM
eukprot:3814219-Rhodomonas_salina.1